MLSHFFSRLAPCRSCLRPISGAGEAGLCPSCWDGLCPLPEERCPKCALPHSSDRPCPDPVAWDCGDALWDYRGGRPAFGSLIITGIKSGETGWRRALLKRVALADLPDWAGSVDLVTSAPPSPLHKWLRGFDLAEEAARAISAILSRPYLRTLSKTWFSGRQARRPENRRRKMPQKNFCLSKGTKVAGKTILLLDDVWTTGTTLLRCAQALKKAGAAEVRVLSLFRAI